MDRKLVVLLFKKLLGVGFAVLGFLVVIVVVKVEDAWLRIVVVIESGLRRLEAFVVFLVESGSRVGVVL